MYANALTKIPFQCCIVHPCISTHEEHNDLKVNFSHSEEARYGSAHSLTSTFINRYCARMQKHFDTYQKCFAHNTHTKNCIHLCASVCFRLMTITEAKLQACKRKKHNTHKQLKCINKAMPSRESTHSFNGLFGSR